MHLKRVPGYAENVRGQLVLIVAAHILLVVIGFAQAEPVAVHPAQQAGNPRDGQHDFDFSIGRWKTHIRRRLHPLTGSDTWTEFEGTSVVRKIWNGKASLGETEADGATGHIEALSLRLYNPQSHQWNLSYANGTGGSLSVASVGEFENGRGQFFDSEPLNNRGILVRQVWSDITENSCRFEQSFSEDGGKTWEVNWIATDTRVNHEGNKQQ